MYKKLSTIITLLCFVPFKIAASAGTLDTTFNPSGTPPGTVTTLVGLGSQAFGVAIQSDGKIVTVGITNVGGTDLFALARYTTDGTLDTTFGTGGTQTTLIGIAADGFSVALQKDGKIVVAGRAVVGGIAEFAVARYNTDGTLDTTFNSSGSPAGTVTTPIGLNAGAHSVAVQSDGKIVAAGFGDVAGVLRIAVVRYNTDGSLDTTFNGTGIVDNVLTPALANTDGFSVALQKDGKIVVGGTNGGATQPIIVRYNADGSLDTSFNGTGIVETNINGPITSVALQKDGSIVATGKDNMTGQILVLRYLSNGTLDTTFNGTGIALISVTGTNDSIGNAVAIQQNGKIVVAGDADVSGLNQRFVVARLTVNGALDTTFNSDGIQPGVVTTVIGGSEAALAVALQTDGKIVVAGVATVGGQLRFAVARYNGDPVNSCVLRFINKYGPRL